MFTTENSEKQSPGKCITEVEPLEFDLEPEFRHNWLAVWNSEGYSTPSPGPAFGGGERGPRLGPRA